jgi:glycosyltransferase involved in cell wall biosynthesis
VRLIANGIRTEDFGAERDPAARAELGIPPDALVVGSVGHLRAEKRPVRLVEALAALAGGPPVHLLLLGDGPERDAVLEAARRLGVAERVHLAGHRAETAPWYAAMDVFALSSDTEQMPVALLEAMASGLPVAATDVGDVRCVLPAEQRDFVVPLAGAATGRALATALERLSRAPELRARLGAENRARVGERYSFDAMLAAYAGLYRSLLPAAKAPLAPA